MPSARWALSGRGDDRRAKTPQPSKKWPFLPAFGGGRAFRDFLLQSPSALPHSHRRRASQVSIYLHGLMQAQPHAKNMERMEEAVAGADYDRLHHFIADSPWQAGPVMDHVACEVSQLLDGPNLLNYTSVSVQTWAAAFLDKAWETVALRQGTKGEIRVQYLHQRVYLWNGAEGTARLWHWVARRTHGGGSLSANAGLAPQTSGLHRFRLPLPSPLGGASRAAL